jgi:hypothetical protein
MMMRSARRIDVGPSITEIAVVHDFGPPLAGLSDSNSRNIAA